MSYHGTLTTADGIHIPFAWEWADAAARTAQAVTIDDINKIGLQIDTATIYLLEDTTPTWTSINGSAVLALGDLTDVDATGGDGEVAYAILTYNGADWVPILGSINSATPTLDTTDNSVIVGGSDNIVTNVGAGTGYCVVVGGSDNQIEDVDNSVIIGGNNNQISGNNSGAMASESTIVNADYAVAIGTTDSQIDGICGIVMSGVEGHARNLGQIVSAGRGTGALGGAQGTIQLVGYSQYTHSTTNWYEVFIDNFGSRITVPTDGLIAFTIMLIGADAGLTKRLAYKIEGVISNVGGTTGLLTSTVTTLYEDDASFDARVQADDPSDSLIIQVRDTDGAGDLILWVYTYSSVELINS